MALKLRQSGPGAFFVANIHILVCDVSNLAILDHQPSFHPPNLRVGPSQNLSRLGESLLLLKHISLGRLSRRYHFSSPASRKRYACEDQVLSTSKVASSHLSVHRYTYPSSRAI